MSTVKSTAVAVVATLMLFTAPMAHAQSHSDLERMQTFLSILTEYFSIIESTYSVSSDHEKAAILQMMKIQEVYEARGDKAASTAVLRQVLEDSKNPTIRNAAYMLMSDTLKDAGKTQDAINLLRKGLEENIRAAQ